MHGTMSVKLGSVYMKNHLQILIVIWTQIIITVAVTLSSANGSNFHLSVVGARMCQI